MIPSYNQGRYLERALQSVLSQGYPDLECLLFDGGSTDESPEIIRRHAARLAFWTSARDRGQSDAIRKGFGMATGEILAWLNSDDFYYPEALAEVARIFREKPGVVMLCGTMAIVDENERLLRLKEPPKVRPDRLLPWGSVPGQPAVFLRREVVERLGGPREDLHYVLDWELWLRVALAYPESRIAYSPTVLAASREWGETKTRTACGRDAEEARRVLGEIFAREALPGALRRLEKAAYGRTWWRQSQGESTAGLKWRSLRSLLRALRISPLGLPPGAVLRHAARTLLAPGSPRPKGARV